MSSGSRQRQGGFIFLALLVGMAVIGVGLATVSEVWHQSRQRELEEELLFVGNQYREAITRYYVESPPTNRRFPTQLQDLLQDNRSPDRQRRYLRKLYADPITGEANWGEIRLASGQLVGVYSLSSRTPLKQANFTLKDKGLANKSRYSEWEFRSALPAANPVLAAGAGYASGNGAGAGAGAPTPSPLGTLGGLNQAPRPATPGGGPVQALPRSR